MRKLLFPIFLILFAGISFTQTVVIGAGGGGARAFAGVPTGSCGSTDIAVNTLTGNFYACNNGSWLLIGPGAAGSAAFNTITSGTNTGQTLTLGNGTTLQSQGTALVKFLGSTGFSLLDPTDTTKILQFNLANIGTGTTKTIDPTVLVFNNTANTYTGGLL